MKASLPKKNSKSKNRKYFNKKVSPFSKRRGAVKPNKSVKATRRPLAILRVKFKFKVSRFAWLPLAAVGLALRWPV